MGYVTIITGSDFSMGAIVPTHVLGHHDVAVYTCLWVIREIRHCMTNIEDVKTKSDKGCK
ncbi:hypothetical protein GCM10009122_57800 [Fulvivirga kasyanovii]